jgi:hypothetical protein
LVCRRAKALYGNNGKAATGQNSPGTVVSPGANPETPEKACEME